MHVGISYGDPNAGLHGAFAVLCALMYRARTGKGQYIDLSQWETSTAMVAEGLLDYSMNGSQPERDGNRDPYMAPHGVFPLWRRRPLGQCGRAGRYRMAAFVYNHRSARTGSGHALLHSRRT